jgi:glyoxylase-like metal-dependent hydrolase (beta-lactamase superfamily II)
MGVMNAIRPFVLLLGLWLGACTGAAGPDDRGASDPFCTAHEPVAWQPVAPSVWVWLPLAESDVAKDNAGHVAPTAVVIDGGEALVVDPGPSHRHGMRVRGSLHCQFGARVTWVINTHAHAETVLANSAFADLQASGRLRIGASHATREGMTSRCPDCLASLTRRIGESAMKDTRIVLPDVTLAPGMPLRVGQRILRVQAVEQGHTEGDLVIWDARHGVLLAGGLVYGQRIPELAQGQVDAWLAALDRLDALPVRELIGATWSRGHAGHPPPALASTRGYLQALRSGVLRAMDEGAMAQDGSAVPLPEYAAWAGYAERHGFNVLRAWRELEPVWMEQGGPAMPPAGSVQQPRR